MKDDGAVPPCPGRGDTFRPYPCGRDHDHPPHRVGRRPFEVTR